MRKHTKRRIWALVDPIKHVTEGIRPPEGDKLDKLRTHELSAIEAFFTGKATVSDWAKVVGMVNLCEMLAKHGIGPEAKPYCDEAGIELLKAAKRYEATRKMGLTGKGLQLLRDVYEFHDLQRTSISLSEYEKWIFKTQKYIDSKGPEVVDVLEYA